MTADDSASVRQMVGFTLREAGYEVVEAASGEEALKRLDQAPVDMLLADVNMPGIDGLELTRRLRRRPDTRFLPVVILTTEVQAAKKTEGKRAGATAWIVKPFRPEVLLGVVRKVLGS